ncbi:MAG TPA: hypothetical protein PKD54_14875, partial [Pirellulaceae bacterium]|nr:hypothetical protein [Pirellulaceae bacterium]
MPPATPSDVGRVVATHTYNLSRRESTGWVEVKGTRHPVDDGVEHDGVQVYLTLMFSVVAVDSASGEVLWKWDWNKLMPTWQTISILEIERPSGKALVVELTPRQDQEKENQVQRLYLHLRTGEEVEPQLLRIEGANSGGSQEEHAPKEPLIDPTDWGRLAEISGLQSRLVLQTQNPQVGQPLLVKLELRNAGTKPAVFDPQDYAPFRVLRVNAARTGAPTSFIGMTPQTSGQKENLDPGEIRLLWDNIDVSELFLLAEEGDYEVYCKGGDWATQPIWRDSNRLRVNLQAGRLPARQELIAALLKVLPEHWTLSAGRDDIYLQHSPTNLKQDITSLSLRFTREKLPDDIEFAWPVPGGDRQFTKATINYFGETGLGHTYLLSLPLHTEALWPGYLEVITRALEEVDRIDRNDPSDGK